MAARRHLTSMRELLRLLRAPMAPPASLLECAGPPYGLCGVCGALKEPLRLPVALPSRDDALRLQQ